ncbi:Cof-type HAD-IIB family hydrolase [Alkalihalobacterium chitinilyticum]|uniref:Cof-type HAD-IIB family hydrolase n=1 Tax=Alkalihalobacterium chitinilyticum TaxID=2980103 RepID=A0ABT5VHW7_9BACI|nr:Cof-type HAD-IIB family hydrolase [Alkalihalobacterium chitinilyticum]MDE5415046.1 Cof-type HAD-IIB family hydrolase [Alkalihalobacterium chitinilyticum]
MIIALDMDGTLLNSDGTISERNKQVIKTLQDHGHLVTIATGRAYKDVSLQLKVAKLECPVISLNGAGITLPDHTMLGSEPLDKIELTPALEWTKEQYDLYFEIYTDDEVYAGIHNLEHLEKIVVKLSEKVSGESGDGMSDLLKIIQKQFQQAAVTFIEDISTIWTDERKTIYKVLIFSLNKEALKEASTVFSGISGVTITSSHPNNIEINNERATKGRALTKLASHYNVDLKDTIVMGDSYNDLSMFEIAGQAIAMENAAPILKENSDAVTKTNDQDGVAIFLETLLEGNVR